MYEIRRDFRLIGCSSMVPTPLESYRGPGDIVASAVGWWGLRAYSAASIGMNAVRLREDGGNTLATFPTIAGGGLNLADIAAHKGANNLFLHSLFDQTGGGIHFVNTDNASQPGFSLSGLGSLPIITFSGTQFLPTAGNLTAAQALTVSAVANHTASATQMSLFVTQAVGSTDIQLGYRTTANNEVFLYAGSVGSATASDGSWHALNAVFNNTSSDMNVDGTPTTPVTSGTNDPTAVPARLGNTFSSTQSFIGSLVEVGLWDVGFSGANSTAMSANQHSYWGF